MLTREEAVIAEQATAALRQQTAAIRNTAGELGRLRDIVKTWEHWLDVNAIGLRDDTEPGNTVQAAWDDVVQAAEKGSPT